jgi:hypothetical protein
VKLDEFMARYPPRPSKRPLLPDEDRLLGPSDGVFDVHEAPLADAVKAQPTGGYADEARHLWVFRSGETAPAAPAILELAPVVPPLASGKVKHSNLTGGGPASCGGELWVDPIDASHLFVNGASGRYGPDTPQHLDDAVSVFVSRGFAVTSFGWEAETGKPARFLRG